MQFYLLPYHPALMYGWPHAKTEAVVKGNKTSEKNLSSQGEHWEKVSQWAEEYGKHTHFSSFVFSLFYVMKVPQGEKKEIDAERNISRNFLQVINLMTHEAQQTSNR